MGEHFVLIVDRLITESTLEAVIRSKNLNEESTIDYCSSDIESETTSLFPRKMVECRICQDEDFDSKMESPCSCCGSLKYAHRRCVQRWCNEKGDTVCEICHQQYNPGYTAPPPLFHLGGIPMNLRGHWSIGRTELNNSRIIAMVSTDADYLHPNYEESTSRSLMYCRFLALLFMVLLLLRHTLPVIFSGAENISSPIIMLLLVRSSGIILSIYIVMKAMTSILRGRHQQRYYSRYLMHLVDEDGSLKVVIQNSSQVST